MQLDIEKYKLKKVSDIDAFVELIPKRLTALFDLVITENGTNISCQKVDGIYEDTFFNHTTINLIEDWALKQLSEGRMNDDLALLLVVYVGEVVSFLSGRDWFVEDNLIDIEGEENESFMLPSIEPELPLEDYSYTPLFTVDFFLRNRKKRELEESLQWRAELEGKSIYGDFLRSDEVNELELENTENRVPYDYDELNTANSARLAGKFVEEHLVIFQEMLINAGIQINLEQNQEYKYVDASLFEKTTIDAISEFYLSKLDEFNEADLLTLENCFSAYIVEMFVVKVGGYADYVPVELSAKFRFAANTGRTQDGRGSGNIYPDEMIERIKKKNKPGFLSLILKGHVARRKFMK